MKNLVTVEYAGPNVMARRFFAVLDGKRTNGQGYLFGANQKRQKIIKRVTK